MNTQQSAAKVLAHKLRPFLGWWKNSLGNVGLTQARTIVRLRFAVPCNLSLAKLHDEIQLITDFLQPSARRKRRAEGFTNTATRTVNIATDRRRRSTCLPLIPYRCSCETPLRAS